MFQSANLPHIKITFPGIKKDPVSGNQSGSRKVKKSNDYHETVGSEKGSNRHTTTGPTADFCTDIADNMVEGEVITWRDRPSLYQIT
jgi:hypothetical protein